MTKFALTTPTTRRTEAERQSEVVEELTVRRRRVWNPSPDDCGD